MPAININRLLSDKYPGAIRPTIEQVRLQFGANVKEEVIVKIAALSTLAEYQLMTAALKQLISEPQDKAFEYAIINVINFLTARSEVWENQLNK